MRLTETAPYSGYSNMSLFTILLELSPFCAILYFYMLWNRTKHSKPPNVFLKESLFNSIAVQYCDEFLRKPYVPTVWAFSPQLHSKYFAFKPTMSTQNRTEYLEVKNGRLVGITWPKVDTSFRIRADSPVVMFIPDPLSADNSVQPFIETAFKHGFRPSVFHHRNSEKLPRLRHASESITSDHGKGIDYVDDWKDLAEAVLYIANKFPVSSLYLVSLSYGSTMLLKFLVYDNAGSRFVKGVATVSPAWTALTYPCSPFKPVTNQPRRKGKPLRHSISLDSFLSKLTRRRNQQVHRERFQDVSTALPIEVFALLKKLAVPMLMIFSRDDPVLTSNDKYRIEGMWKNSELLLVVETANGGHAGFLQGLLPESWAANLVFVYFEAVEKFKEATVG